MKRNVLIFGSILGMILAAHVVYMMTLVYQNPDFQSNDVVGYAAMVVVFSLTFFGIRNYRNKQLHGTISLGRAFKTGALIALVGATFYVVIGLSYYYLFIPDFLDKYIEHVMIQATRNGATGAELAAKTKEMEQFREMYKNQLFVVLISYAEVLPVGLVVAFIGSLILKRKSKSSTV
jgi:amino acid transporter